MEVLHDGRAVGRATAVTPSIVVTASHVVSGLDAGAISVRTSPRSTPIRVRSASHSEELDVAALHLETSVEPSRIAEAVTGADWQTVGAYDDGLPILSGNITGANVAWTNSSGNRITAIQLQVDQGLGTFRGYSGGGVSTRGEAGVFGVLVQQGLTTDLNQPNKQRTSGVLHAVPLSLAVERLGIDATTQDPVARPALPSFLRYHDEVVASLRGYRSNLSQENLRFVAPERSARWHPRTLWRTLSTPGSNSVLLTGHGGVGKTRTMLEVGDIGQQSGWDVIHVRGGNTARVADTINDLLSRDPTRPILLMADYLHLARELDLLALSDLTSLTAEDEPRFSMLATSRTGWVSRNRFKPGLDAFQNVPLDRTREDTESVCASIVRQIAPVATESFGEESVLAVTGTGRPILAVLLGKIVEAQVAATGQLPQALVSEDLAQWLQTRLLEDQIVADVPESGEDLPDHLMAAAIALTCAPDIFDSLVATTDSVLPSTSREKVEVTLRKLENIGWLVPGDVGVEPAHDVVVDKLLEAAIFHHGSDVARASSVEAILRTAFTSPSSFTNAWAALERVLDERDSRGELSKSLTAAIDAWLSENATALTLALPNSSLACARVCLQLLETSMLTSTVDERWRKLVAPMLDALGSAAEAAEPLQVAAKSVRRDAKPNVASAAHHWLRAQPRPVDELVLNATLARRDVEAVDAAGLIELGLDSVSRRADSLSADFTLRRLLKRTELTPEQMQQTTDHARDWLSRFGDTRYAAHLLSAVVDQDDAPQELQGYVELLAHQWMRDRIQHRDSSLLLTSLLSAESTLNAPLYALTRDWFAFHGEQIDAGWVLQPLLRLEADPQQRGEVAAWLDRWISAHPTDPSGSFLLKALLSSNYCKADRHALTVEQVATWLAENGGDPDVDFVIRAVLKWPGLSRGAAEQLLWPHVRLWLVRNRREFSARYVLSTALSSPLSEPSRQTLWECLQIWLELHATAPKAVDVLGPLVRWGALPVDAVSSAWSYVYRWLAAHHQKYDASYLLPSTLSWEGTAPERLLEIEEFISSWLALHWHDVNANHVLHALVQRVDLSRARALYEATVRTLSAWMQTHRNAPEAGRLLTAAVRWPALDEPDRQRYQDFALDWLPLHPTSRDLPSLLIACFRSDGAADRLAERLWEGAQAWLAAPYGGALVPRVLQQLLEWEPLTKFRREPLTPLLADALDGDTRGSATYMVMSAAKSKRVDAAQWALLWPHVRRWLERNHIHSSAHLAIAALAGCPRLPAEAGPALMAATTQWLASNQNHPQRADMVAAALSSEHSSPELLNSLLSTMSETLQTASRTELGSRLLSAAVRAPNLSRRWRAEVKTRVDDWMRTFGSLPRAIWVLQALMSTPVGADADAEGTRQAVLVWLDAHWGRIDSNYLLKEAIKWPGMDRGSLLKVLDHAARWLTKYPHDRLGLRLAIAGLQSRTITNAEARDFATALQPWLRAQNSGHALAELTRSLRSVSGTRRALILPALGRPSARSIRR